MEVAQSAAGLEISEVSKRYGDLAALSDVDLRVERGTIVGLLGNNGAGKSTLMNICAGVLSGDAGTVSICGRERLASRSVSSREVGYAPQDDAVYPTLSVRRNLEYFAELAGLRPSARGARVRAVAADLLLEDLLDRKVRTLSGGQRRRVHLALAVMHDPKVILLDEATVGIDVESRHSLLEYVKGLAANGGAVLYSTHQLHEAEYLDLDLAIIDHGRVIATGRASKIVDRHSFATAEITLADELPEGRVGDLDVIGVERSGDSTTVALTVRLPHRSATVTEVVATLDPAVRDLLVSVSVRRPSLEQAFLTLTSSGVEVEPASTAGSPGPSRERS